MKKLLLLPLMLFASNSLAAEFSKLECKGRNGSYSELRIVQDSRAIKGPTGALFDNYNSATMACGLWALDRVGKGSTATCVGIWRSSYAEDGGDVVVTVKIRKVGDKLAARYLRNWDEGYKPDVVEMDCQLK